MADQTKRIVYTDPNDGHLCILSPALNTKLTIAEIQAKDVPSGVDSYIVNTSDIPTNRSFRDAWSYTP